MELRCSARLHGLLDEDTMTLEVKCHSKACGAGAGVTVLHYFDLSKGQLIRTKKFREPQELFTTRK